MKTLNENVSITYERVKPDIEMLSMVSLLRKGLPLRMRRLLETIVSRMVMEDDREGYRVSYQLARSTYGKEQHMNFFEQFSIGLRKETVARYYIEYADDPNHKIDALKKHRIVEDYDNDADMRKVFSALVHSDMMPVLTELKAGSDQVTFIDGDVQTIGFWFKHDHGMALIAIETKYF